MNKITYFLFFITVLLIENCFAGISVIGGLTQKKVVAPGEKVEGIILLKNTEDTQGKVKIYQTEYLFYADGKTIYGNVGTAPRSNAKWISVSPNILDIPANSIASAYYIIKVPEDSSLKGSYWSIIMVEIVPIEHSIKDDGEISKDINKAKLGIKTLMRYGIQIITNIGDTGEQKIKFLDKKIIKENNSRIFQFDIENIGDIMLIPSVWIELFDINGKSVARIDSEEKRIFPGCSVKHSFDITVVPKGNYKASVIVDNGNDYVFGAHYDISIE